MNKQQILLSDLFDIMQGSNPAYIHKKGGVEVIIEEKEITGRFKGTWDEKAFKYVIKFKDCIFKEWFHLGPSKFSSFLNFEDCVFEKGLFWNHLDFGDSFHFNHCKFLGTVHISSFECFRFSFIDCIFYKTLNLTEGVTKDPEYQILGKKLFKREGGNLQNIKAEEIILKKNNFAWLTISYHFIGKLEVGSGSYEEGLVVDSSKATDRYPEVFKDKLINELRISLEVHDNIGKVTVQNSFIKILELKGDFTQGNILIDDVEIGKLSFNSFTNSAVVKVLSLKAQGDDSKVEFLSSYLGKIQFFNIKFDAFNQIYIDNSHLTEIQTTYVSWPRNITTKDNSPDKLKENYRQLKMAMKKQEDNFQALIFEQEEMRAYERLLKEKDGDWEERFILLTNEYSNNYGKEWITPITWMTIFNVLFFVLIGWSISGQDLHVLNSYLEFPSRFLHLFNPTHQPNLIHEGINNHNIALIIDFISRIFSSYFIFQTIRSFRKYAK